MKFEGRQALITGASAGIGRELARQLADRAELLILVARRGDRLEELSQELAARHPNLRFALHPCDLSDGQEVTRLIQWVERERFAVDLLINNAGLGDLGPFATADPKRIEQMLQVNMVALTRLTRALLPAMIARREGAVLNVSSSASFLPIPNFAVYAATKAYVTSFSDALRSEVRGTGVKVTALCPGPVHTEFTKVARRSASGEIPAPESAHVPVEKVATAALDGLARNRPIVIPGGLMKFGIALVRLTPRALLRFGSRFRR